MIKFNDLRVDPNTKKLIINAQLTSDMAANAYINKVFIHTQDTLNSANPNSETGKVYSYSGTSSTRSVSFGLASDDFGGSTTIDVLKTLFFVEIEVKPTGAGSTSVYTIGITFSEQTVYDKAMKAVKEVCNTCKVPKNFINYYLQFKALLISLSTKHYQEAINLYNKYFINETTSIASDCSGC